MAKPDAPLPDATATNWVDRHAPEGLKPWLKLGRFDRPIGIWLLLLPGWWGIALADFVLGRGPGPFHLYLYAAFAAGAALMRAAGCAWNDIVDRDIDAKVERTASRPIPAGQISVKQALAFIAACCAVSLAILLSFNLFAVALGAASLLLVAAYPFMKRITWWPQAWLGLTFNWGVLLGAAAALGPPVLGSWDAGFIPANSAWTWTAIVLLYAAGVFWTLGYDTIYALQDIEDDALAGVKSSARRLGRRAKVGVLAFYLVAIMLTLAAWWAAGAGAGPWFLLPFAAFGAHLMNQVARLRLDDPALALAIFKSNREAGILLFAALVAGLWR